MAGFDKDLLFKSRLPEADVPIEGIGVVRVRALSRDEVMTVRSAVKSIPDAIKRQAEIERKMLSIALVDPVLTEAEVGQWQKASTAGELEPVTDKISELSGLTDDAAKAAYKEFESSPDGEFRVLPGPEAGDDGGPTEG